jgi:carboxymethylenebutenolidase
MGGGFVIVLAAQQGDRIGAAVPFYGALKEAYPDLSGLTAPLLGHFGEEDSSVPPDSVRELAGRIERESGTKPDFRFYPAGHAFYNDENPMGNYDKEQGDEAWAATLDFLRAHLS